METTYSQVTQADRIYFLSNINEANYYKPPIFSIADFIIPLAIGMIIGIYIAHNKNINFSIMDEN